MEKIKDQGRLFLQIEDHLIAGNGAPYLPQTILDIQRTVEDPNAGAKQLAGVILEDPALTARILKLANSVFFNCSGRSIKTVTDAIVVLGFEAIRNVAIGFSVLQLVNNLASSKKFVGEFRGRQCP